MFTNVLYVLKVHFLFEFHYYLNGFYKIYYLLLIKYDLPFSGVFLASSCFDLNIASFFVNLFVMSSEEQPIQTLYINNLNDKLPKEQLKQSLYLLFSQFGTILDVVALKTQPMRGQAWVSFLSVQSAVDAKNKLQGFEFFGKPMV